MADSDSHNSLIPLIPVKFELLNSWCFDVLDLFPMISSTFFVSIVNSECKSNFIAVKFRKSLLQVK